MNGTSPYLVYASYLATILSFEFFVSSLFASSGLSAYRSEKVSMLIALALLIATHRLHFYQGFTSINFSLPGTAQLRNAILFSMLLGIAGIGLIGVQVFLTAQFAEQKAAALWGFTGIPGELGFYDKYFGSKSGLINLMLFASTQFFAGPLAEEIYFKGIILAKLLTKYSTATSILITSILFAIAHDHNQLLSVFVFSVLSCYYYIRCRSIWILVCIHGLGNLYDWLYSGFGGITFLEGKRIDELGNLSTWTMDLLVAAVFIAACILFLIRISSEARPSPSPESSSPSPDQA